MTDEPTVLVVDDEENITEVFSHWLRGEYAVRTATSGDQALDLVDDEVDVVLLDRRMPGMSGDEVLEAFRDQGYDLPTAMVTAVDPDFDIVDMAFDTYLTKPIMRDELVEVVEELVEISEADEEGRQQYALEQKEETLSEEKSEIELEQSDEYDSLTDRVESLRADLEETVETMNERTDETDGDEG